MKKLGLVALLVIALPACCSSLVKPHVATKQTVVGRLQQSTVALVYYLKDGHEVENEEPGAPLLPYCAGTWIGNDTILTDEHCVDDIGRPAGDESFRGPSGVADTMLRSLGLEAQSRPMWTPMGQPVKYATYDDAVPKVLRWRRAKVIAVDMHNDLVVLRAEAPPVHPIARLAMQDSLPGDELHLIGMAEYEWWCYHHGYVSAHRPHHMNCNGCPKDGVQDDHDMWQVEAPIYHGDSGGGGFNVDGDMIGVINSISSAAPDVAFLTSRAVIGNFLRNNGIATFSQ